MKAFRLSAELFDGMSAEITEDPAVVLERVRAWLEEFKGSPGESFSVEVIELSRREFDALPEL